MTREIKSKVTREEDDEAIRRRDGRYYYRRKPIKRLPIGKQIGFTLPNIGDPAKSAKYQARKVTLINAKNFKNLGKYNKTDEMIGSLKLR